MCGCLPLPPAHQRTDTTKIGGLGRARGTFFCGYGPVVHGHGLNRAVKIARNSRRKPDRTDHSVGGKKLKQFKLNELSWIDILTIFFGGTDWHADKYWNTYDMYKGAPGLDLGCSPPSLGPIPVSYLFSGEVDYWIPIHSLDYVCCGRSQFIIKMVWKIGQSNVFLLPDNFFFLKKNICVTF